MSAPDVPVKISVPVTNVPKAELLGFAAESLLFGVFAILASISLWILIYRQKRLRPASRVNMSMAGITIAMLVLAGAHLVIDIQRTIHGFLGDTPGGPSAFFGLRVDNPTYVAKPVLFTAITTIGDCFMAYRTFVLWERNWAVITFPVLLILGTVVTGIGSAYGFAMSTPDGPGIFTPDVIAWTTAFLSLSLVTNLITTLLLLGRILWFARDNRGNKGGLTASVHWKVMKAVFCSEGIYSAALIANLGVYSAASSAVYTIMDILPPLVGISFTLIILRIGLDEAVLGHSGSVEIIESSSALPHRRGHVVSSSPIQFTRAVSCMWDTANGRAIDVEGKGPSL
ncbi:hypothetical protein VTO73DRAFT_4193 [Trametes versicolor]